jgi:hypothetical protein
VQKTKRGFCHRIQAAPVGAHRFQQVECAHDVGLNKFTRAEDAAVDMALGRKVHDSAWLVLHQ